ncbi:MAG: hypothetical protein ACKO24_13245 [Leptolyngbyaceae cyanobacterium]
MSQDSLPPDPLNPEEQPTSSEPETLQGEFEPVSSDASAALERSKAGEPLPERPLPPGSGQPQSQALRRIERFWDTWQPRIRQQTIRVLRSTSQTLEHLATRLEADRSLAEPSQVASFPGQGGASTSTDWLTTLGEITQSSWRGWQGILAKVRLRLPATINQVLPSDQALTGAIAGVLVLLLWTVNGILSPAAKPVTVAVQPVPVTTPTPTSVAKQPTPAPEPVGVKPTPAPAIEQPQIIPTPLVSPEIKPSPPPAPPLKLTPQQKLIARIQDEVAEITDQYVSGLIQSVQANFRASRLTVTVGPGWYGLSRSQQDNLANQIYLKTRNLDFADLEIRDSENHRLARSPVVGSEMVILQRSREGVVAAA